VREARKAVIDYARLCGFETSELDAIELAVGEALTNAVEHGAKDLGFITVSCAYDGRGISIEVRDEGFGFDFATQRRRDPLSVRGFGITIMRELMDRVEYGARGNIVRLYKRRPAPNESPLERQSDEA
jgi:anti-sigma regulatory factor (Ser/Thr protein kinase)